MVCLGEYVASLPTHLRPCCIMLATPLIKIMKKTGTILQELNNPN